MLDSPFLFKEVTFEAALDGDWWVSITFPCMIEEKNGYKYALRVSHQELPWCSAEAKAFLRLYNLKLVPWARAMGVPEKDRYICGKKYFAVPR